MKLDQMPAGEAIMVDRTRTSLTWLWVAGFIISMLGYVYLDWHVGIGPDSKSQLFESIVNQYAPLLGAVVGFHFAHQTKEKAAKTTLSRDCAVCGDNDVGPVESAGGRICGARLPRSGQDSRRHQRDRLSGPKAVVDCRAGDRLLLWQGSRGWKMMKPMLRRALRYVFALAVFAAAACVVQSQTGAQASQLPQAKYALVIGITGYEGFKAQGEELKYADRDAADFAAFIQTTAGGSFPTKQVHLVTNKAATRDRIFAEFNWLSAVKSTALVYVFFAGHGAEYGNETYLLPVTATPDKIDAEGTPMSQFFRRVTVDVPAMQAVVFIDACRAAAAVSGMRGAPVEVEKAWEQRNAREGQVAMGLFSSLASESSYEDPDLEGGHGLFTYYLIEALKGQAERTKEGLITANSVLDYVREQVAQRSLAKFHSRQTPNATPDFRTGFVLAYAEAPPSVKTTSATAALGIIQVSSVNPGSVSLDDKDMGEIAANGRMILPMQSTGPHRVQFKGTKAESIDVVVEGGSLAEANFGIVNPINKIGSVPTGELHLQAVRGMSGEVYLDNYRVGHLEENGELTVPQVVTGTHIYRVIGPNKLSEAPVVIEASKSKTVTIAPPTGLTAIVQ
jgi:Caspase domain